MASSRVLVVLAAILIPSICFANVDWRHEAFRVTIRAADGELGEVLSIQQNGKTVFNEMEIGGHYYLGNKFESGDDLSQYSISDITGNGIPDLVVSKWSGGAHCCHYLNIFELGRQLKHLTKVEGGSHNVRLVDLNGDRVKEIEFWDGPIDYLFASFASSPPARVVLKYEKNSYKVATEFMKKPRPTSASIVATKAKIVKGFTRQNTPDLPYQFLETMMRLSYSGNISTAMEIANETWPKSRPGLKQFKKQFREALDQSKYWREFAEAVKVNK